MSAIRLSSSSKPQSNEARQNTYPESAVQPFDGPKCIELWLELRCPNEAARTETLTNAMSERSIALSDANISEAVAATNDFTRADLKRLVAESKTLYAFDLVQGNSLKSATDYLLAAAEIVLTNKQHYMKAQVLAQ